VQDVIEAAIGARLFYGYQIVRFLNNADQRAITFRV
jgi:hypothetical protein